MHRSGYKSRGLLFSMRNSIFVLKKVYKCFNQLKEENMYWKTEYWTQPLLIDSTDKGSPKDVPLPQGPHDQEGFTTVLRAPQKGKKYNTMPEFLAESFSNICFQLFLCFLTEKVIIVLGHSIMKTWELEGAPHFLLFPKFHLCFSRTCLKTPSRSHLRETAGV